MSIHQYHPIQKNRPMKQRECQIKGKEIKRKWIHEIAKD